MDTPAGNNCYGEESRKFVTPWKFNNLTATDLRVQDGILFAPLNDLIGL